jgi:hypothetical protein
VVGKNDWLIVCVTPFKVRERNTAFPLLMAVLTVRSSQELAAGRVQGIVVGDHFAPAVFHTLNMPLLYEHCTENLYHSLPMCLLEENSTP